jgi:cytoskeleton protein RodZ
MIETTSEADQQLESGYTRIGRQLNDERVRQKLTVAQMSTRLNLSGMIIEDLENGRVDRLAGLYRRGYITNYSRALGLDPATLLAELDPDQPPELREVLPVSKYAGRLDRFLKIATYVLVTTVIVPPLVIIYYQSGSRMVEGETTSVIESSEQHVPATSQEEGMARRLSRALNSEEAVLHGPAAPGHVSASALPLSAVRPVREPESAVSVTPDEPENAIDQQQLSLTVRLQEDSWVEISASDGQRLEYDLLRAGHERSYLGKPPFRILLGRASAVDLEVDGRPVEYDGHDRGDVVQLQLLASGEVTR